MAEREMTGREMAIRLSCVLLIVGIPLWAIGINTLRSSHIMPAVAIVLAQQQVGSACITAVSLAPDINGTITEDNWPCEKSSYVPQRPAPLRHKWRNPEDFGGTSWQRSSGQPSCSGFREQRDLIIAGAVLTLVGLLLLASGIFGPCLTRLAAGGRVADGTGTV